MSKFLQALARMNLIELDEKEAATPSSHDSDQDIDKILAETRALMESAGDLEESASASPKSEPVQPPPELSVPEELNEGQALDNIYSAAGIPSSPYPAEQMLRLLEGLKAMGPRERKIAVMAMDSANDRWTIADPVLDAQRKIDALNHEGLRLQAFADQAEAVAAQDLSAQEEFKVQASKSIREQISELETLLEQELQKVAEEKASIHLQLESTRSAVVRERARFDTQIDALYTLSQTFGSADSAQEQS